MIQIETYSINEVFEAMDNRGLLSDGNKFKPSSSRMILFRTKGIKCVTCEISGSVFILETHDPKIKPHLNLYALNSDDKLVLMTKDHIYPKSLGGANEQSNYQTMCTVCNSKKKNKIEIPVKKD
jgi:5-methylcytosine-specific restriction endonuclease McrA